MGSAQLSRRWRRVWRPAAPLGAVLGAAARGAEAPGVTAAGGAGRPGASALVSACAAVAAAPRAGTSPAGGAGPAAHPRRAGGATAAWTASAETAAGASTAARTAAAAAMAATAAGAATARRALREVRSGRLSAAARSLLADPPAPSTPAVWRKACGLFPPAAPGLATAASVAAAFPADLNAAEAAAATLPAPATLSRGGVEAAIRSAGAGKAPGPSGLWVEHLWAMAPDGQDALIEVLLLLAGGRCCPPSATRETAPRRGWRWWTARRSPRRWRGWALAGGRGCCPRRRWLASLVHALRADAAYSPALATIRDDQVRVPVVAADGGEVRLGPPGCPARGGPAARPRLPSFGC
nr:PhM00084.1 [Neoporphyra haitanensis]